MKRSPEKKTKKHKPFAYVIHDFVKVTAALPGLVAFRPKIYYENRRAKQRIRGGALLIANHIGFSDPVVLQFGVWYRRHHFICLDTFFEKPVSAWFFRHFHCIPINRENMDMNTLREIVAHLKNDELVSMFPEGHMVIDNRPMDAFKSGMVLMAVMSRKPIIPVYIAPRRHWLQRARLVIGEPVDIFAAYGPMPSLPEIEKITEDLRAREARLVTVIRERKH